MGYFDSVKQKPALGVVAAAPPASVTQIRHGSVHPYAQAALDAELARLDECRLTPVGHAPHWDITTFEVACNLIEIANSPWSGYTHGDARADLDARAPRDAGFNQKDIDAKWASAEKKIGPQGRPEPAETQIPNATVLVVQEAETDALAPPLNPILDWHELFSTDDDGEEWIIEPLLPARRMIALYSAPKAGKSLLMLEIAVGIARGTEVIGATPDHPRRVLYVDFENDPRGDIRTRLEAMEIGPEELDNLCYLTFPSLAKFDTSQGALDLLRHVQAYECEVVIIDTVSRAVGGEENDNDTWLAFYRNTGLAMKQAGVACIRLDHSGKDVEKGMRGGSAKYGDVDAVWRLTALSENVVHLECTDHRMQVPVKSLTMTRQEFPLRHEVAGDAWQALSDARVGEVDRLLDSLGMASSTSVREAKQALREAGHKYGNAPIEQAVKLRKLRLDIPPSGCPGDTSGTPGDTRREVPPGPASLKGGRGGHSGDTSGTAGDGDVEEAPDPDVLVSCKSCFKPTSAGVAEANGGICATCHRETGQETP